MDDLKNLVNLLEKAEQLASQYSGGYSNKYLSAEEFHADLKKGIEELKGGNIEVLNKMWSWFAPTCDWDGLVGIEGIELGNAIYEEILKNQIRSSDK